MLSKDQGRCRPKQPGFSCDIRPSGMEISSFGNSVIQRVAPCNCARRDSTRFLRATPLIEDASGLIQGRTQVAQARCRTPAGAGRRRRRGSRRRSCWPPTPRSSARSRPSGSRQPAPTEGRSHHATSAPRRRERFLGAPAMLDHPGVQDSRGRAAARGRQTISSRSDHCAGRRMPHDAVVAHARSRVAAVMAG